MLPIRAVAALCVVSLLAFVPTVSALTYSATGGFLVSNSALPDACVEPALQGKSSTCAGLRSTAAGRQYHFTAQALGPLVGVKVCFYDAAMGLRDCHVATPSPAPSSTQTLSGTIPADSAYMAVMATQGLQVRWLLIVD